MRKGKTKKERETDEMYELPSLLEMDVKEGKQGSKKMQGYRPQNALDCSPAGCFECVYINAEHCLNCRMREYYWHITDPVNMMKEEGL